MATYQLKKNPTLPVEIDGKTYELNLGNFTFILDARKWLAECEGLQNVTDTDEVMDALERLSERARIMIESAVGKDAAQELIGEEHRLDLYRIMDVMHILTAELSSDAAMTAAQMAITRQNATLDHTPPLLQSLSQ